MNKERLVTAGLLLLLALAALSCVAPAPQARTTSPVASAAASPAAALTADPAGLPPAATPMPARHPTASPVLQDAPAGYLTISKEQHQTWTRNFNPLLIEGNQRWPTRAGIYEPLLVYNVMTGEFVPWLATSYAWSSDSRKLTFTTRDAVLWSDGRPFSSDDVAFTFNLIKRFPSLDVWSVWSYLQSVSAPDDQHVEFVFTRPYVPSLPDISQQPIVPKHVWKDIQDPVNFANENPVGTGPFTEVKVFQDRLYELGKNPHYWQPGKPYIEGLRFPAFKGNEEAVLALYNGEVDWAGNFIPDARDMYAAADPDNHYWFPAVGGIVHLYVNTTRKPFDAPNVRKAISMGIDREQIVSRAEYDYVRPADATGMSDNAAKWKDPRVVDSGTWVRRDVARANQLLDAAGLVRGPDGMRIGPDGKPMKYDILVVTGWDDWVATAQILADNLRTIGIDASAALSDYETWFERVQKGDFDLTIGWSTAMPFPYNIYREKMSCETVVPVGERAGQNWQRYCSRQADVLLNQLAVALDPVEQKTLVRGLQKIFVDEAPAIPLFPGPSWGEYSTKRFVGWPDESNPYAKLTPNDSPGSLLVLTAVRPR